MKRGGEFGYDAVTMDYIVVLTMLLVVVVGVGIWEACVT